MKIALCSDELYPVQAQLGRLLEAWGHQVQPFGALSSGREEPWALAAERAALAVKNGDCDQGIFSCWSGTGICMAANKVAGIRAALCTDPGTAVAARTWNHANVLCLSNRLLSDDMAKEILESWFATPCGDPGNDGVHLLKGVEERNSHAS